MNNPLQRARAPVEPRVVALGGGGGGLGRSTVVRELGRWLTRRGRSVLLVELDAAAPTLHLELGLGEPPPLVHAGAPASALADAVVEATRARPAMVRLAPPTDRLDGSAHRRWMHALRTLPFDYVLFDAGGRAATAHISLFSLADVPVITATAEASSLIDASAFLGRTLLSVAEHTVGADRDMGALREAWPDPVFPVAGRVLHPSARGERETTTDGSTERAPEDDATATIIAEAQKRLEAYLVMAHVRDEAERRLGEVMAFAWLRLFGVRPRVLGSYDADPRRWFHVRQDGPGAPFGATAAVTAQLEAMGERLLKLQRFDEERPRLAYDEIGHPAELLGLHRSAELSRARAAYRDLWEGFRRSSALTDHLLANPLRESILRELEEASRRLQRASSEAESDADAASAEVEEEPVALPGERIRAARQSAGLSLRELSLHTKIGLRYLESIEGFDVDSLPRPVYLRGYLREIARVLEIDGDSLLDDYLTCLAEARTDKILRSR